MSAYTESAQFYDLIYHWKDYPKEAENLLELIESLRSTPAHTLLDVACGTGAHLVHLQKHFECAGVDISKELLEVARKKLPTTPFYEGDMRTFNLERRFDVVTCLFSAIGYMQNLEDLRTAAANMAHHVAPGGLLIIEPWFHPGQFQHGALHGRLMVDLPDIKIARMNVSLVEGDHSIMDMHHLVLTRDGGKHFVERHVMSLFPPEAYLEALTAAGLQTQHDPEGLGRGLFIGTAT